MAQRRMFSKKITDTDKFLDMPLSSQALYFHLNMDGDDEGYVGNPKTIKRKIGASDDDLKILVSKQFIIPFESGVIVIKDWRIHNTLQNDRFKPTIYQAEKMQLESGFQDNVSILETNRIQNVSSLEPQHNLTKHNITKQNIDKDILSSSDEQDDIPYKLIIDYLNKMIDSKYRASGAKTKSLIKARFNEGFTFDDFKHVISVKSEEWLNTDMARYLRPETLFGNKFEQYLNQKSKFSKVNGINWADYERFNPNGEASIGGIPLWARKDEFKAAIKKNQIPHDDIKQICERFGYDFDEVTA
ncbi:MULTISPECIES: conserved phage C-terminal domain-containing protein [unclassified Enterococcus]|uniref:conserved phage C-terminal domain-containing protein n=1 Tax=unclassified Enterococcus TaxID=2608891 RepID=UPI001553C215|nr:conserved phage C-terminal domain-containing protein [Enterococcus sp. MMGLQ5-2]MBS7585470.1 conserved phage C-terminal domain-containing protein [Enterococcus sp. MMGLQ5-1]NPD13327.1 DNA replication protein [Enterococcus sp. MMGLQ5-1]NPD38150.1 DNA replication protein [Enterococcus sp. MMGLQ5-2]